MKLAKQNGQFTVCCGKRNKIYIDNGMPTSKLVKAIFYLGNEYQAALLKRQAIKSAWQDLLNNGLDHWTQSSLDNLANQNIISKTTASPSGSQQVTALLSGRLPPDLTPHTDTSLSEYFNPDGSIQNEKFGLYLFSILRQELTTKPTELAIRRAIANFAKENPLGALHMGLEYWQDLREEIKMETPKEFHGIRIFSASPDENGKITHCVDNNINNPYRVFPSEAEIRAKQTAEENANSLFADMGTHKPQSDIDADDADDNTDACD